MESFAFDANVLAAPFTIGCVIAAAIAWFFTLGGWLRLSLGMTMNQAPGCLACLLMVFLIMIGNSTVVIGI